MSAKAVTLRMRGQERGHQVFCCFREGRWLRVAAPALSPAPLGPPNHPLAAAGRAAEGPSRSNLGVTEVTPGFQRARSWTNVADVAPANCALLEGP